MSYPRAPRRPRQPKAKPIAKLAAPAERYCSFCDQSFAALSCPECERPLR